MSLIAPTSSTVPDSASSRSGALDQRFALDVQGVDALRRITRTSPQEGLKQVSRQFEALFMQMVLKSMREATPGDGMLDSQQSKLYTSMLDQQWTQSLSGRGLGLAEAMQAQLGRSISPAPGQAQGPDAAPAAAKLQTPALNLYPQPQPLQPSPASVPDLSLYEAAAERPAPNITPQGHVEQFVSRMAAPAQAASRASGVPAQLILAQAALESGWGRREIRGDNGGQSHNLFGIKADKSWKGPVVETTTTEYVDGVAQRTKAAFRAYGSYQEAFTDYARFLTGNPRYAEVLATRDPAEAAHGLQRAGYATDPQYGGKLVRIMKQIF